MIGKPAGTELTFDLGHDLVDVVVIVGLPVVGNRELSV